jgi:hypothetical protein
MGTGNRDDVMALPQGDVGLLVWISRHDCPVAPACGTSNVGADRDDRDRTPALPSPSSGAQLIMTTYVLIHGAGSDASPREVLIRVAPSRMRPRPEPSSRCGGHPSRAFCR